MHLSRIRRVGQHTHTHRCLADRELLIIEHVHNTWQTCVLLNVPKWASHVILLNRRHWHACNPARNCDNSWLPGSHGTHQTLCPKLDGQIRSLGERIRICLTVRHFNMREKKYYYTNSTTYQSEIFYCIKTAVTVLAYLAYSCYGSLFIHYILQTCYCKLE